MTRLGTLLYFAWLIGWSVTCKAAAQDPALSWPDSLQQLLSGKPQDTSHINVLNSRSRNYINTNQYDLALIDAEVAKKLAVTLDYPKGIVVALNNLGLIYADQGNYPEAIKNYLSVLKFSNNRALTQQMANTNNNIGLVYLSLKDYNNALKYLIAGLELEKKLSNQEGMAGSYGNIGLVYAQQGDYKTALQYYEAAVTINVALNDQDWLANNYGNMGILYFNQGNFEAALEKLQAAKKIKALSGDKISMAGVNLNMGRVYIALDQADKGKKLIIQALELGKTAGAKYVVEQCYLALAIADSALGNFRQAFENHKMYLIYHDSLFNEANTKKQTQTEMQFAFDKKLALSRAEQEKKDAIVLQKMQKQQLLRNGLLGGFSVVFLFALVFFKQRNSISKAKNISDQEKQKSDELLLNILPSEIAAELKQTGASEARLYNNVTVLFTDFVNFTGISEQLSPTELVAEIHKNFTAFDAIIEKHGLEKIKTIGDAYLAVCGLPHKTVNHAEKVVLAALEICEFIQLSSSPFQVRMGINSGPVVAGIVGVKKYAYDIWGDTVNTAARMEQNSEAGKINISGTTYELVKNDFSCIYRGKLNAKNKGKIEMYFVSTDDR